MSTKKDKNDLPAPAASQLPATYHDYGSMSGSGFEGATPEDFAMPFLALLQPLSKACQENPDARPGMLMNTVSKELFDGKKGIIFVPCARQHNFVEWKPKDQGGGIVARHEPTSDVVVEAKKASKVYGTYFTGDGNELVETFYFVGFVLDHPEATEPSGVVVVTFSSTKIKTYKRIMQVLNTFKGRPPLFANRLLITSVQEKNNKGSYFNYSIAPLLGGVGESLIPPGHPLLHAGQELNKQVQSGMRRMADESLNEDENGGEANVPF